MKLKLIDGKTGKETKREHSLAELSDMVNEGPSGACSAIHYMVQNSAIADDAKKLIFTGLYMLHLQILVDRGVDISEVLGE